MRIVFSSNVMHEKDFEALFSNANKIPGQQVQKFHRLFIDGFKKNGVSVSVISSPPVTPSNYSKRFVRNQSRVDELTTYFYLPVLNIRRVKHIFTILCSFIKHIALLRNADALFCDVLNISVSLGGLMASKLLKKPCVGLVTDMPELMVSGCSERQARLSHRIIDSCDMYVFAAAQMDVALNSKHNPYVVIEGISTQNESDTVRVTKDVTVRKILYAGMLEARYGVNNLVEAFISADLQNVELHLCGSGSYVAELEKIVQQHTNVVFHGTVWNSEVVEMERKATLLVNPRPTHEEFVKYSFPSKNIEYMSSGTPVLTTKLPSMPLDYYPYIYTFSGEDLVSMKNSIVEVMMKSNSELVKKGIEAKRFITEEKNSKHQVAKIIEMIKSGSGIAVRNDK